MNKARHSILTVCFSPVFVLISSWLFLTTQKDPGFQSTEGMEVQTTPAMEAVSFLFRSPCYSSHFHTGSLSWFLGFYSLTFVLSYGPLSGLRVRNQMFELILLELAPEEEAFL